jgi:hypothetical protein
MITVWRISYFLITTFVALLSPHQDSVAAEGKIIAKCDSQFVKGLVNAPMVGSPRDDVWILEVLDKIRIIDKCDNHGSVRELADYLERLWLNDVIGDVIPVAKTMADAARIENETKRTQSITMEKSRQRAHTMSFSVEMRKSTDPFPRGVEAPPQSDTRKARNIWPSRFMSPPGTAVALAFTNITQRKIFWPNTDLFIRNHGEKKHVWFHCESEKRVIAQAERFVVFCATQASNWKSDNEGLALLDGLNNRDNWFLRPNDTRHFRSDFQRVINDVGTQQSWLKASDYIKRSTCEDRNTCLIENPQPPVYHVPAQSNPLPDPDAVVGCFELGKKEKPEIFKVTHVSGNKYRMWLSKTALPMTLIPDGRYLPPIPSEDYNRLGEKEKVEIDIEHSKIEWHLSLDIAEKDRGKPESEKTRMMGIVRLKPGVSRFMGGKTDGNHFGVFVWFADPVRKIPCPAHD